jgi:hypothetical protein
MNQIITETTVVEVSVEQWTTDVVVGGHTTIVSNGNDLHPKTVAFAIPTKPWIVNHNLNYIPQVCVTDLAGNQISIETTITNTQIIVDPAQPTTGYLLYR